MTGLMAMTAPRGSKVRPDRLALRVRTDSRDYRVTKVTKVTKASQVRPAPKDSRATRGWQGSKVRRETRQRLAATPVALHLGPHRLEVHEPRFE